MLSRPTRVRLCLLVAAVSTGAAAVLSTAGAANLPKVTDFSPTGRYAEGASLVSGRLVDPPAPRLGLGDFPVAVALSPDGTTAVVVNSGQGQGRNGQADQSLQVVDVKSHKTVQIVSDKEKGAPAFYNAGIAWSRDGKHVYVTGGGNDQVYDYTVTGQRLRLAQRWKSSVRAGAAAVPGASLPSPPQAPLAGNLYAFSRGLAVLPDGSAVIVTNEQGSTVAALSTADGTVLWETVVAGPGPAGGYPGSVAVSPEGARAYVTNQGLNTVATFDTASGALLGQTPVGDHPVAIALTGGGSNALVANANDDSLSVLDLASPLPRQVRQLSAHLVEGEANGSTPTAIGVDDKHGRVYVTLAGDNAVAVYDTGTRGPKRYDPSTMRFVGAVPTGAYPTAVAVQKSSGRVLSVSGRGYGGAPITSDKQYIANIQRGLLTAVPRPEGTTLKALTTKARALLLQPTKANTRRPADSPIPDASSAGSSPIEHVVLVVRENRTFDQVFGDLSVKGADVEPKFLQFGEKDAMGRTVTPNAHALARQFGLSQNFYSDGEASVQGHHWTTAGVSTDYIEKSYVHHYSDRNHPYDPTLPIVYPRCGAIFHQLAAQGQVFRNFGELVGLTVAQAPTAQVAPQSRCGTPGGAYDPVSVASFSNEFGANVSLTSVADTEKEAQLEREYTPLAAAGQLPAFTYVVLGNDHTDGTSPGTKTPQAHVAVNDKAIGDLVEYFSGLPTWSKTAIFIVEDDSQDGLDHRDGHRNILLVASPYAKKGHLSSLHTSQASVLRTIELILGLEPLSSYTQYAAVPYDMFTSKPDLTPYTSIMPTYPFDAMNPETPRAGTASAVPLDLSRYDVAGPVLEAQIWEATRPGEPMPAALLAELELRGGIRGEALDAWADGRPCRCTPLRDGLSVAPGGDGDD